SLDGQASWQHLELPEVAPGEAAEVELPTGDGPAVTVRLLTREAQGPVPADHLIIAADHVDADALAAALPAMSGAQSPQRAGPSCQEPSSSRCGTRTAPGSWGRP